MRTGLIDFSNADIDKRSDYGGSDRKRALYYDGDRYMLKFSEKTAAKNDYGTSNVNNVISEHLGSKIVGSMGLPVHETILGTYNGELVVACKNFVGKDEVFHEFSWYMRNQFDSNELARVPKLSQIYETIKNDPDLAAMRNESIERYWDTFVADAVIGNFDRHSGNWGYIVGADDQLCLAPIYDCGSSLYPNLSVDKMQHVLSSKESIAQRLYEFPKAALMIHDKGKVGYYDMMASGFNQDCTNAVLRMTPRIDIDKINEIINSTPILSEERKVFYKTMIDKRVNLIVRKAESKLKAGKFDTFASSRIGTESFKEAGEALAEYEVALGE